MIDITMPHNGWEPRPHQMRLWEFLQNGGKRAVAIWHRRAGKDEVCLHHTAMCMMERPGNYWHMLPTYTQGRVAIWDAVNPETHRRRIEDVFPKDMIQSMNETKMFVRLKNQATLQIIGSDQFDSTVGSSAIGCVYSEWALSNPEAWAKHKPMLDQNDGWAVFISTPRGRNHCKSMYDYALKTDGWFGELLTAADTRTLTKKQLRESRREYQALYGIVQGNAQFDTEMMCSFNASVLGSYFGMEMQQVREEGRIIEIDAEPDQYVHRAWDLGMRDDMSIWFFTVTGSQVFILDHYANSGYGFDHYAEIIEEKHAAHGWKHGTDYVPHDAKVREIGTGRSRVETMITLGLSPMLVPLAREQDSINAARRTLPLCVFHPRCDNSADNDRSGIAALEQYRREWDDERKAFKQTDYHDWTSHPAAAFRYLSMAWQHAPKRVVEIPKREGWYVPPPIEVPRYRGIQL